MPAQQLEKVTKELAAKLASSPSLDLGLAKKSIYQGWDMDLTSTLELEARVQALCMSTEDAKEAVNAFLEKRQSIFRGK